MVNLLRKTRRSETNEHHRILTNQVRESLELTGKALILDCHSFPQHPLPYELDQAPARPQICIGVDAFHTPDRLTQSLTNLFSEQGLTELMLHLPGQLCQWIITKLSSKFIQS